MADKPILLFPKSAKVAYQRRSGGGDNDFKRPSKSLQTARIDKMFKNISTAFDKRRIEIQQNADDAAPEMVLVFETRGTVEEFFKAIKETPELKFLGEFEKDFDPTPEYNYKSDPNKPIHGKLYFVLVNNAALRELRSLWGVWKTKKQEFKQGETRWKHLFNLLYDLRIWNVKDRIEETGILEDWKDRVDRNEERIPLEIELWYRKSSGQRAINIARLTSIIEENNGHIIKECFIDEINYHALLIDAPISIFDGLLEDTQVKLLKSSEVMFIRPVGQSIYKEPQISEGEIYEKALPPADQLLPPVIALLDGVPMQNHYYLAGRINILDPDNFQEDYPANARRHGTSMASLIIHGDLNQNNNPLRSYLLVRPVMKSNQIADNNREFIPENFLLVDLIHKAVRDVMEDVNLKKTIKIINISLGDSFRIFDTIMSSWAKLLDWLSEKYNVLFVVSAGNISDDILFENLENTFAETIANIESLGKASIKHFYSKNRFRKIISPAESINSLTVGASHADSCGEVQLNNRINLFEKTNLLSPFSRMGLGYRKSIKPDILANGGRVLFRQKVGSDELQYIDKQTAIPPGIKSAYPVGGIKSTCYTRGTSNSAALVSHHLGKIFEDFQENDLLNSIIDKDYFPVVSKSLIIHSASWDQGTFDFIQETIDTKENKRDAVTRFLGYGTIDSSRIIECTDKRVTLIGFDSLRPENASVYELPLPNSLSGKVVWRKIVATLAWFTPINCDNLIYRTHKLWFDFPHNDLDKKLKAGRIFYNDDTVRRGTVQHEIFYGDNATAFSDNENLKIKVNCKTDAIRYDLLSSAKQKLLKPIKYGLVVTLEVDPLLEADIYNEISLRIKPLIRVT